MKLTWYGHSTFRIETGGSTILLDPFLEGNPSWDGGWEGPSEGATHILLTHGHDDHVGSTLDIAKKTGATVIASYEIIQFLTAKGLSEDQGSPINSGGTVGGDGFSVTAWPAFHSSSTMGDNGLVYLGQPLSLVLEPADGKAIYISGDTGIFSDMALIAELHQPAYGILCVGDRLTMGPKFAALACKRYFDFETVIPCHYGTFPFLKSDASEFEQALQDDSTQVMIPSIGEPFEL